MMNKKKNIFNIVFLIVVFSLTMYGVFHGKNLEELSSYIKSADIGYWIIGILFVICFICGESIIIYYMMKNLQQHVKLMHCFLYSFVGFFFSCITPSATGGQPAQIYFMKKDKIPIPVATLVLMIVTITYKLVLVVIGLLIVIIRPTEIMHFLKPVMGWMYLGIGLNVFCVTFMMILVFHGSLARNIINFGINILSKLHIIRHKEKHLEKAEAAMDKYGATADYFRENKHIVVNVFIITFVQRIILFLVTFLTYKSFRLSGTGMVTITALQGMISVAVDMLPLPGGMGISEKLFLEIFAPICGKITLPAMVVSRGLAYYTQLTISAIMTIVAQLTIGRIKREGKK